MGLINDQQPFVRMPLPMLTIQKRVESLTNIFEGIPERLFLSDRRTHVQAGGECREARKPAIRNDFADLLQQGISPFRAELSKPIMA